MINTNDILLLLRRLMLVLAALRHLRLNTRCQLLHPVRIRRVSVHSERHTTMTRHIHQTIKNLAQLKALVLLPCGVNRLRHKSELLIREL